MKKLKLVPKEKVRLVGFSKAKTKIVQPEIPYILFLIERMEGRKIMWPEVIRPMTKEEFSHGRTVIDEGHPRGAGHGQYDPQTYEVAVNKNMNPFDIAANIFHENLHHARPDLEEVVVRDTTGDAMLYLYGEYNLGKPYAEGRLKANPRTRRNSKKGIVIVKGRYVGSLADYLSKYAKDFTKADLVRIKKGWDDYEFGEGWRQYYDFNDREYVQVFKEILYIDPDRVGFHVFNEYGDENWRWYRTATKKEKMEWAKDQWKRKGRNPIMIKVDANYGISTGDGHHRLRAAKLLGKQVPVVIESSTRSTYDEAKKIVEDNIPPRFRGNPKKTRDSKGRLIPQKYLSGYKGAKLKARIKEIEQRRDEYKAALQKYGDEDLFPRSLKKKLYRPFKTDKGRKGRSSSYTVEAKKRGFKGDIEEKAKAATKYYGSKIPSWILDTVMDRGMAAWAAGGHRPGQTPQSWGYARVNSFLVGGKTFWTADNDLARKLPKKGYRQIADQSVYSPTLSVL